MFNTVNCNCKINVMKKSIFKVKSAGGNIWQLKAYNK